MTTKLEIALAVLVVVFGVATLAFVIYFLVKKCCRGRNASNTVSILRPAFVSGLQHIGTVADHKLGLTGFEMRPRSNSQRPNDSRGYLGETLDVFGARPDEAYGRPGTNRLTLTAALQDYYEKTVPSDDVPLTEDVPVRPLTKGSQELGLTGEEMRPRSNSQRPNDSRGYLGETLDMFGARPDEAYGRPGTIIPLPPPLGEPLDQTHMRLAVPEIRPKTYFELADGKGSQELGLTGEEMRPRSNSQRPNDSRGYLGETLDVFGARPDEAYGRPGTTILPSHTLRALLDEIHRRLAVREIRPKTYFELADGKGSQSAENAGVDVSHGMFISKTLDQSGGSIELYGVTLNVPPGALSSRQNICLGVLWTSDHQPKLSKKEATLSPIVICQPHGLQLLKAAILTVPHCAVDVSADWTVTAWCSETTLTAAPDWRKLDRAKVELLPCRFKLTLDHFTLYTASGEGKSAAAKKWIDLVAFAPPLTGKEFPIRVYCLNDYTDDEARDVKKMAKSEIKQKGKEVTSPTTLAFHNDGKNLRVEIEKMSEPWSLSDITSKLQELDFEQIWHGLGPSCKFVLTSAQNESAVECSIIAYQMDHADKKQKLAVAEEHQVTCDSRIDPETLNSVFPAELCDTLKKMLDPDVITKNNWIALAEHMDIPLRDIHWLADDCRKSGRSPTVYLLNQWVQRGQTVDEFRSVMMDFERHDIVDELDKWRRSH